MKLIDSKKIRGLVGKKTEPSIDFYMSTGEELLHATYKAYGSKIFSTINAQDLKQTYSLMPQDISAAVRVIWETNLVPDFRNEAEDYYMKDADTRIEKGLTLSETHIDYKKEGILLEIPDVSGFGIKTPVIKVDIARMPESIDGTIYHIESETVRNDIIHFMTTISFLKKLSSSKEISYSSLQPPKILYK